MSSTTTETKPKVLTVKAAKEQLSALAAEIDQAASEGSRLMVRIGIALASANAVVSEQPKVLTAKQGTFIDWAKRHYDVSQPRIESLVRSGRVAVVIGPENIDGSVSESALEQLHKLLADKSETDAAKRSENVTRCWTKASRDGRATIASVKAALESLFPEVQGSRGPKAGSDAAAGNGKAPKATTAPKAPNKPTATGPVEVPDMVVSGTRLKAAATSIGALFAEASNVEQRRGIHKVALQIIETAERYGIAATKVAIDANKPKAARKNRETKAAA